MPLFFDTNGQMKPLGLAEHVVAEDAMRHGSLSSKLVCAGDAAIVTTDTVPELVLKPAASNGAVASIYGPSINRGPYPAMVLEVTGLKVSSHELRFEAGFEGSDSSAFVFQDWAVPNAELWAHVASSSGPQARINITRQNEGPKPRDLTLILLHRTKELFILVNGAIMGWRRNLSFQNASGVMKPYLKVTNRGTTEVDVRCQRIRVTAWTGPTTLMASSS